MSDPDALCTCGHTRDQHESGEWQCSGTKPTGYRCRCDQFWAQASEDAIEQSGQMAEQHSAIDLDELAVKLSAEGYDWTMIGPALLVYDPRPERAQDGVRVMTDGSMVSDTPDHAAIPVIRRHRSVQGADQAALRERIAKAIASSWPRDCIDYDCPYDTWIGYRYAMVDAVLAVLAGEST